jgi:hypothetical protein
MAVMNAAMRAADFIVSSTFYCCREHAQRAAQKQDIEQAVEQAPLRSEAAQD